MLTLLITPWISLVIKKLYKQHKMVANAKSPVPPPGDSARTRRMGGRHGLYCAPTTPCGYLQGVLVI